MSSDSLVGGPYVGAMMRLIVQWVREQIYSGVVAVGFDDLNPAHVGLFQYQPIDGLRPSALAERLQITKQSVNDLLAHLEQQGYLLRRPDPTDGRARVVRLTAQGRRLDKVVRHEAHTAEQRIAGLLGTRQFDQLRHSVEAITEHIALGDIPSLAFP